MRMSTYDVDEEALAIMRARNREGVRWAAYQNLVFDSTNFGSGQYLMVGPGCTYSEPPKSYPADTKLGLGWKFELMGFVDLDKGEVYAHKDRSSE